MLTSTSPHNPLRSVDGAAVAAYTTVRGATLAAEHLESAGIDRERIAVRPALLAPLPHALDSIPDEVPRRRSVVAGALCAVVTALVAGLSVGGLVLAALAGAAGGILFVSADTMLLRARRARRDRRANTIQVHRFDVVCSDDRATHLLGSWWDPEARPSHPGRQASPRLRGLDQAA